MGTISIFDTVRMLNKKFRVLLRDTIINSDEDPIVSIKPTRYVFIPVFSSKYIWSRLEVYPGEHPSRTGTRRILKVKPAPRSG